MIEFEFLDDQFARLLVEVQRETADMASVAFVRDRPFLDLAVADDGAAGGTVPRHGQFTSALIFGSTGTGTGTCSKNVLGFRRVGFFFAMNER